MRKLTLAALLLAAGSVSGCDTYHFLLGTWRDDTRKPVAALKHYEAFLASRPEDPRSCQVRLRAAEIYRGWGRWAEARHHYEAAARGFPQMKECAERAKLSLLSAPDYFPLDAGRTWVYVDSDTKGRAMRLDWEVRRSSGPGGGSVQTSLFAGNTRIREATESYAKQDWGVWRTDTRPREPFLRYPFAQDQAWSGKRTVGKASTEIDWLVVSATATVTAAAGTFKDCLKVRERDHRFLKTWRYDYYCPDVGRVKTTVGGPGYENPNTELLRFDKIR